MYSSIRGVLDRLRKSGDLEPVRKNVPDLAVPTRPTYCFVKPTSTEAPELHSRESLVATPTLVNATIHQDTCIDSHAQPAPETKGGSFISTFTPNAVISTLAIPSPNVPPEDSKSSSGNPPTSPKSVDMSRNTSEGVLAWTRSIVKTTLSPAPRLISQEHIMEMLERVVECYYDKFEPSIIDHHPMDIGSTTAESMNECRRRPVYDSLMQQYINLTDHLFESTCVNSKVGSPDHLETTCTKSSQDNRNHGVLYRNGDNVDWNWVSDELLRRLGHQVQQQHQLHGSSSIDKDAIENSDTMADVANAEYRGDNANDEVDDDAAYTPENCQSMWRLLHSVKLDIRATYDPLFDKPSNFRRRRLIVEDEITLHPPSFLKRLQQNTDMLHLERTGRLWDPDEISVLAAAMEAGTRKAMRARTLTNGRARMEMDGTAARSRCGAKRARCEVQQDVHEVDWSEIQRQHLPWRREGEISLRGYVLGNKL